MAFKGCGLHKSYRTREECLTHCDEGEEPVSCDRCRGYYVKRMKRRKVSQKVYYKQSGGGRRQ